MTPEQEALVIEHLPLVRAMARRIVARLPPWVELQDLIAAGAEGLVNAALDYDAVTYPNFEPYASKRIHCAFFDELRRYDSLTRYGRRKLSAFQRGRRYLEMRLGRAATDEEAAAMFGVSLEDYQIQHDRLMVCPGLQGWSNVSGEEARAAGESPEDVCIYDDMRVRVREAMTQLPERKRQVLELYFSGALNQPEIARKLGTSESRVCQIVREATTQIREILDDEDEPVRDVARAFAGVVAGEIPAQPSSRVHESPATVRPTPWAASGPQRRPSVTLPFPEVGACGV